MKTNASKPRVGTRAVPAVMMSADQQPEMADRLQRIATAAYFKAEARGFVPSFEMEDWLQAEAEVGNEMEQPCAGRFAN